MDTLFIIYCISYFVGFVGTTIWCVKIACTYNDKIQDEYSIVISTFFSITMGVVWPVAWCYIGLYAFAQHVYKKSKTKADEATDKRRELEQKKYEEKCDKKVKDV